ncbi:MAG: FMN-binding glutamate synthase family protein, partial [Phycisphaerae bacterium]
MVVGPLLALGLTDAIQRKHTIRRNFPLLGRFRYMFEAIRPEIQQYFVESDLDGKPFSREQRTIVYQRGKLELATLPFGTRLDNYSIG